MLTPDTLARLRARCENGGAVPILADELLALLDEVEQARRYGPAARAALGLPPVVPCCSRCGREIGGGYGLAQGRYVCGLCWQPGDVAHTMNYAREAGRVERMIDWKRIATIEFRYARSIERDYRAREAEINRMYFPAGRVMQPVERADIERSAQMWRAMVDGLQAELRDERAAHIATTAELEGWKDEALAARRTRG